MSIDLEVFHEAVKAVSADIKRLRSFTEPQFQVIADNFQWMLVQADSLTKKVAKLEKSTARSTRQMDQFKDPEPL